MPLKCSGSIRVQNGLPLPTIFGMKQLLGASPNEGRAARARCFAIGTHHHRFDMGVEEPRAGPAVAQLIVRIQVIAASGTDDRTPSFWMIDIEPFTAYPAFVHLDVTIAVIDHIRRTAFAAYHLTLPCTEPYWRSFNNALFS